MKGRSVSAPPDLDSFRDEKRVVHVGT